MNIGIIAYNAACNFGANLQLLSTSEYIKNSGHKPYIINWVPESLEQGYRRSIPVDQYVVHEAFRKKWYTETNLCRNAEDVALEIKQKNIQAVIIGSDAVAQHHPFLSRINFPSRHIIIKKTEDSLFPNVFWGTFNDYLERPCPIAILSASCQNSAYTLFSKSILENMRKRIDRFLYVSTRDDWTSAMYSYVTNGKIMPPVTPDPVFAFNYNVKNIPSKEEIQKKFNLADKYILFSFFNNHKVDEKWLSEIEKLANHDGYECVSLAFPSGVCFKHPFKHAISIPLDPIDWYCIIKYSSGYIGHNMHPIVVSIHNSVPFFSFDNYGVALLRFFVNEKSSKIHHILSRAGFIENRTCDQNIFKKAPTPQYVYNKIRSFNKEKCHAFAQSYYDLYQEMMQSIYKCFKLL